MSGKKFDTQDYEILHVRILYQLFSSELNIYRKAQKRESKLFQQGPLECHSGINIIQEQMVIMDNMKYHCLSHEHALNRTSASATKIHFISWSVFISRLRSLF